MRRWRVYLLVVGLLVSLSSAAQQNCLKDRDPPNGEDPGDQDCGACDSRRSQGDDDEEEIADILSGRKLREEEAERKRLANFDGRLDRDPPTKSIEPGTPVRDFYHILRISRDATDREIAEAYIERVAAVGDEERFPIGRGDPVIQAWRRNNAYTQRHIVERAFDCLSNPPAKAAYDAGEYYEGCVGLKLPF